MSNTVDRIDFLQQLQSTAVNNAKEIAPILFQLLGQRQLLSQLILKIDYKERFDAETLKQKVLSNSIEEITYSQYIDLYNELNTEIKRLLSLK